MPTYQIHVINSDFDSCSDFEAPDLESARIQGMRGVLGIGTDELCKGIEGFFGAEVRLELNGEVKQRFMVAIGQCPLM